GAGDGERVALVAVLLAPVVGDVLERAVLAPDDQVTVHDPAQDARAPVSRAALGAVLLDALAHGLALVGGRGPGIGHAVLLQALLHGRPAVRGRAAGSRRRGGRRGGVARLCPGVGAAAEHHGAEDEHGEVAL